jgi:hypothetical protein
LSIERCDRREIFQPRLKLKVVTNEIFNASIVLSIPHERITSKTTKVKDWWHKESLDFRKTSFVFEE